MANRTLDTAITQVAVDFFDDDNFSWHHRLLIYDLGGGRWVAVTPDGDVEVLPLGDHRVIPLQRNARWPQRVRGDIYAFDPVTEAQIEDFMQRGGQLARMLGLQTTMPASQGDQRWLIADPAHKDFNTEVADTEMHNADVSVVRGGTSGLYCSDAAAGLWVHVERVLLTKRDEWLEKKRSGPGRDLRISAITRDSAGKRTCLLKDSVNKFVKAKFADWPFEGPCASEEVFDNVA